MAVPVEYSARFELPELLEVGRDTTMQCRVYRAGALVAPTSGTVTLYNEDNEAVIDGATITDLTGDVAKRDVALALLADVAFSDAWRVEWALTMPDGVAHTFQNEVYVVRRKLYSVVTDPDLYRINSSLDPSAPQVIHTQDDFADKRDEAWVTIQQRLIEVGNRPNQVVSPSRLREANLRLALALIFEDFATRLNAAYAAQAKEYRAQFEAAWTRVTLKWDSDEDGAADDGTGRAAKGGPIWTCGRP